MMTSLPNQVAETEAIKALKEAKAKKWHHDCRFIKIPDPTQKDGFRLCRVEDVVRKYQETGDEDLFELILENYDLYGSQWAYLFAPYLGDVPSGKQEFRVILFYSVRMFDGSKSLAEKDQKFNALFTSSGLNMLKNYRNKTRSRKNHPHIKCQACDDQVYEIDAKHLTHRIDFNRYKATFHNYPIVSRDGLTRCPMTGNEVPEIDRLYLKRIFGTYTVADFEREFPELLPKPPFTCPITDMSIRKLSGEYPSYIKAGYTEEQFVTDFPNFPGIIQCPFSGKKMLAITQEHLDQVLDQGKRAKRVSLASFLASQPNATLKAKQVQVMNPYTGQLVDEITPEMLAKAGTTVIAHLEKYATISLEQNYPKKVIDPFTGGLTRKIKRQYLEKLGKTTIQFYGAVCEYPLRKWQVKCGYCGEWVDNIWSHLEQTPHFYAPPLTVEDYEHRYGSVRKYHVTSNSYVEDDDGERIHISDLFSTNNSSQGLDLVEVEDSLLKVSQDDLDIKIAKAVRSACTLDDIYYNASERRSISLPTPFKTSDMQAVKKAVRETCGTSDFGIIDPKDGAKNIKISIPGRTTIRRRLQRMVQESDLGTS